MFDKRGPIKKGNMSGVGPVSAVEVCRPSPKMKEEVTSLHVHEFEKICNVRTTMLDCGDIHIRIEHSK
jgi:hypothetical protein